MRLVCVPALIEQKVLDVKEVNCLIQTFDIIIIILVH